MHPKIATAGADLLSVNARERAIRAPLVTLSLMRMLGLTTALASVVIVPVKAASADNPASMASAERKFTLNIPAQKLSSALVALSNATGTQLAYGTQLSDGLRSSAISGTMPVSAALTQILNGTGLTYRLSGNVVTLVKASANITLGPVRVAGTVGHESPTGPGVGYVATTTMAGTKTDTPIIEIPNSIYVVTKQLMQDQQPQSVVEALRYTPGVYAEANGTYSNGSNSSGGTSNGIYQRGFGSTPFVDGLQWNSAASGETAFLERITAVNGPSSVMYGQLTPGGMIAEDLKKPTNTPLHQVSLGFGNWGRYEATLDFSDKMTKTGDLRYRIAAIGVTSGTQTDYLNYHRVGVLPSITWDIDRKTSLTLLGMYMYTPGDGSGNTMQYPVRGSLIVNSDFPRLSRKNFLGASNWNTESANDAMFEYQFKHDFNKYISFSQTFRWERTRRQYKNTYLAAMYTPTEEVRRPWEYGGPTRTVALDSRLGGHISTGSVEHSWIIGSDFRQMSFVQSALWDFDDYIFSDIYDPHAIGPSCMSLEKSGCAGSTAGIYHYNYFQEGVYFQDQIKWKKLSILLGGREDWVDYHTFNTVQSKSIAAITTRNVNTSPQPQNAFTWRAGLIYNFDFGLAPYFSYGTSFVPQTSTDWKGTPFAPLTGNQLEAGLKYKVPNKDILITASAFRINEDHYLINDLVHTGYSTDGGRVRSQGFEVSANANITKDFKIVASYSYTDIRFAKTNRTARRVNPYKAVYYPNTVSYYGNYISESGMSVPYVPRNMFSTFFDYKIPKSLAKGLGFNWGLRYVGFTYADDVESFKTKPYVLFDLGAHYDFGDAFPTLKGLRAQIAVSNLTNKYYVASCSTGVCYVGQARRIYGNLMYNW